eukprot:TRINITY_DN1071_c0_g1_i1.p1 TRINITY_DN1071_c0_g1~~TRINITY_DN1071_c0_g1_i1.p1  ORF type:complete len:263 (-),score=60.70 TRINITY_DN1071_c0_g1_i1:688-1476(-)
MSEVENGVGEEVVQEVVEVAEVPIVSRVSAKKVYVGNLAYQTRNESLANHMAQAGTVVSAEVMVMFNGRSKGCGLVEFSNEEEAQVAVSTLNDTTLDDRMIFVREDREPADRAPRQPRPHRVPALIETKRCYRCGAMGHLARDCTADESVVRDRVESRTCYKCGKVGHLARDCTETPEGGDAGRKLFISNLSYQMAWQDLKDAFSPYGPVIRADVLMERGGRSKGVGVVIYENAQDASRAIQEMDGVELFGRSVSVRLDRYA